MFRISRVGSARTRWISDQGHELKRAPEHPRRAFFCFAAKPQTVR